jgi:hypothetical protein
MSIIETTPGRKNGREWQQAGAFNPVYIALIALLIVIVGAAAYFLDLLPGQDTKTELVEPPVMAEPVVPPLPPASEVMSKPETQVIPEEPANPLPAEPVGPALPLLSESDGAVRDSLADIPLGSLGQQYLLSANIIERTSSVLYLMAQGDVPYKLIPIARPKVPFPFSDDGLKVTADAAGFSRYDALSDWLRQLDIAAILDEVRWLIPLFREAWSFYGESPETFDVAVVNVLNSIIATPEIDLGEARLIRKEAVWIYEDEALEALTPLQKQIIRMGPDNALMMKAVAGKTRDIVLSSASQP